jgi:two-component system LytT family response regulator
VARHFQRTSGASFAAEGRRFTIRHRHKAPELFPLERGLSLSPVDVAQVHVRVFMNKLRILIVDDEPLARARIRAFLHAEPSVEVAGEIGDGNEALGQIQRDRPDIVFLDVQMPGCNGMQLLAELPPERRPAVIVVTAHDRFAVEAFAMQVVDFLLKPFDRERFHTALGRAIEHVRSQKSGSLGTRLESLLERAPAPQPERIVVKADGRMVFLKPNEIVRVEAANNYSILHLANAKRLVLRETMSSFEQRIGSGNFARVNRSALVHLDQVQELQTAKYGDHIVVLRDGTRLSLSRSLRGNLGKLVPGAP